MTTTKNQQIISLIMRGMSQAEARASVADRIARHADHAQATARADALQRTMRAPLR